MLKSGQGIARFLLRLNIAPAALSLVCILIPQPVIWILIGTGLYLLYGYWRIARGKSPGPALATFWLISLGVNVAGAFGYIITLGGEFGKPWAAVFMAVGLIWTLGTAFLSWRAYRFILTNSVAAETAP